MSHHDLPQLEFTAALSAVDDGATVLDVRDSESYSAGHITDSVQIGFGPKLAILAKALLPADAAWVLVSDADLVHEAAAALRGVGFEKLVGWLDPAAAESAQRQARTGRLDTRDLARRRADTNPPHVVDVRTQAEWDDGCLAGAQHLPLDELEARSEELPRDRELVVICRSGYRSTIAASLLERRGFSQLYDAVGGMLAWDAENDS